ncbi:hypothetical protein QO010_000032 [Caulobacter ginsengisoli]|uniref:PDZ domain-containing protein n=1 Tax=Caulobacter ginsengisoli TaxID=400775 RepID=A0ABU0IMQ4_9CAUL|nr:hypothetical protein [Caulobacter ginsengisoli]MDQ0462284.1 hypothetical protein [Caulobacter ginsengisoli]
MNRRQALLTAGAALALPSLVLPGLSAAAGRWTRLDLSTGLIFVEGTVNGRSMPVMLDSGSVPTLIDLAQARDLGLSLSGPGAAVGNAGGPVETLKVGDFELSVAGVAIRFPKDGAEALDLSPLRPGAGAIAGQALFDATRLDLDLPRARLRIAEDTPTDWWGLTLSQEADGLRCMPLWVGKGPAPGPRLAATFDLGSAIPLQISREWAESHRLLDGLRQSSWVSTGIDGASQFTTAVLPRVELANFELSNVPVAVVDRQPAGASPAVIGMPIWRRFRLVVDYPGERLWFKPASGALDEPFNRDRSGLAVRFEGAALTVIHVARASPAEAGGWSVGEQIVAIDSQRIDAGWPGSRQSGWARGKPGSHVRLTLADGRQRDLVLADYY